MEIKCIKCEGKVVERRERGNKKFSYNKILLRPCNKIQLDVNVCVKRRRLKYVQWKKFFFDT